MAVRMKQTLEQDVVAFCKSSFELRKPMVRNGRDGFCCSQHSHAHVIDLRGVSKLYKHTPLRRRRARDDRWPCIVPPRRFRPSRASLRASTFAAEARTDRFQ